MCLFVYEFIIFSFVHAFLLLLEFGYLPLESMVEGLLSFRFGLLGPVC